MKARILAQMLEKRGFHVYFVGGYVRDYILGIPSNDVDLATNARPEQVEDIFSKRHNVKTVGKSFGVVLVDGIEIATFRKDRYAGFDHKDVEVTYSDTIEEDLSRRDFTVNAMAMDLHGNITDPFNGFHDVKCRNIRFVGDSSERIREDPNRMLRACRFEAQIHGVMSQDTRYAVMEHASYMRYISPERVRQEILKAMKTKAPSRFFYSLDECGLLKNVFPSLAKCRYHTGGNYHPEDVFTHSMYTGDAISARCPLTRLAGYLHDVGKPVTYNPETGQFLEHEKVGADIVSTEMQALTFSNEERKVVTGLIKMHMRTATVLTDKGVRRLLRKLATNGVHYRDYLRLFLADRNANLGQPKMSTYAVRHMINTVEDQMSVENGVTSVKDLKVNGYDVMTITGINPGPRVGQILDHLLDLVTFDPSLNTEENLKKLLKNY